MKYSKPEIERTCLAVTAIQNHIQKAGNTQDVPHPEQGMNATATAYEADE